MDDSGRRLLFICLVSALVTGITCDIIVQDQAFCGSLRYPKERILKDTDEEIVTSQKEDFYLPGKDCVVSILGKTGYQFSITVEFLQVDKNAVLDPVTKEPIKCYDFLNLYDSPRIDHAKSLTPITGLCGNQGNLPQLRVYVTSCPFLAIEFVTDPDYDSYRGFTLRVVQYPWRNPGNIYPGAGLVPGAAWSCYYSEFQPGWDNQGDSIPGDNRPPDNGLDFDRNGIYCYQCDVCPVDYFEPKNYPSSARGGCYRCAKQFDISRGDARRRCYSQSDYLELLLSFKDASLDDGGYLGCRDFVDEYNSVIKYCFCEKDYCNSCPLTRLSLTVLLTLQVLILALLWPL